LVLQEIVVGSNMDKIYIVMDYVEHDLKVLMEHMTQGFRIGESTCRKYSTKHVGCFCSRRQRNSSSMLKGRVPMPAKSSVAEITLI